MAVQTPPFVLQNSSHGSELVRREALASLPFGSAGGVVPATPTTSANLTAGVAACSDLKVNAPASGMSVLVNAGQCYVPGTLGSGSGYGIGTGYGMPTVTLNGGSAPTVASTALATSVQLTSQGVYYCYSDNSSGQVSLTIASSNPTNPRIDVVIAQVEDAQYSGSNNDWKLAVVTGTAAASPTVPSLPANALVLAYVWVPANATNIVSADILDLRYAYNRNPFRASVYNNGTAFSTAGVVPMDTVWYDLIGMNALGAAAKITAPVAGLWVVTASTGFAPAVGVRNGVQILKNGSSVAMNLEIPDGTSTNIMVVSRVLPLNVGDTVQVGMFAAQTGAVGVTNTFLDAMLLSVN